jgi:DNA-binding LacI/PurR family transcriptional regulator
MAHYRVHPRLTLISIDDIDLARFFCPALTTMRQLIDAMIARVLNVMLE